MGKSLSLYLATFHCFITDARTPTTFIPGTKKYNAEGFTIRKDKRHFGKSMPGQVKTKRFPFVVFRCISKFGFAYLVNCNSGTAHSDLDFSIEAHKKM